MSVYLNPIANGILVFMLIIYMSFIPILVHQYRTYGVVRIRGSIVAASFALYMITAWFMTLLPLPSFESVNNMKHIQPNLRPFLFIKTFMDNSGFAFTDPGTWLPALRSSSFYTVAFNVVLTIPFGVYLRKYFKFSLSWIAVLGLLLSLFYEFTQYTGIYGIYPRAYRFADVDDLMINTLGAMLGYYFAGCIDRYLPNPANDREISTERVSILRRVLSLLIDAVIIKGMHVLSMLILYRNADNEALSVGLFLVSEAVVLLLIPLLTERKQTFGMLLLKIYLRDRKGSCAKTSSILLRNLFIGVWIYSYYGSEGRLPSLGFEIVIFQLLFIFWLLLLIIKSISQRRLCFYWEQWFDAYLKVYHPC